MSDLAKLKKKAAELEQRRQFDKALAVYEEMLLEQEGSDDADVSLLNRVGDLRVRLGRGAEALDAYERAVELYVERGFLNNAIALCNKILRQDPRRTAVHYRLGRISAEKGFRSDARRHFLDYAGLMQATGRLDEAFAALQEFAELSRENGDVRLLLAEQLAKHGRTEEAVAQLTTLLEQYETERRYGEAEEVADRIRALDPSFAAPVHPEGEEAEGAGVDDYRPHATPTRPHTPTRSSGGMPDLVLIEPTEGSGGSPLREPASGLTGHAEGDETLTRVAAGVPQTPGHDDALEVAGDLPTAVELVDGLTTTSAGELAYEDAPAAADGLAPALDGFEATDLGAPDMDVVGTGALDMGGPATAASGMDALVDAPLDIETTSLEVTGFESTGFE
ncbi:MAG TPA: tetratricopeptide repeat protein, partial [Gemmatimonadaceae bacterium]|nr:tetratricopeptide repeat protein [Gemmatimonadaceae bacterium]